MASTMRQSSDNHTYLDNKIHSLIQSQIFHLLSYIYLKTKSDLAAAAVAATENLDASRPRQSARHAASVPSIGAHNRETTGCTCLGFRVLFSRLRRRALG